LRTLRAMTRVLSEPRILQAVATIKEGLAHDGDFTAAVEAYAELSKDEAMALWVAPSKGGIWTTAERRQLHSDEFAAELRRHKQG